MHPQTAERLLEVNRKFYLEFGEAFARTRQRLQPGVLRILKEIPPDDGKWMDIGCGSGALAANWAESGRRGLYVGIDFSPSLLLEARKLNKKAHSNHVSIQFYLSDLSREDWAESLKEQLANDKSLKAEEMFDGVFAFAVLHHIPGANSRVKLLQQVRELLPVNGLFIHSEWQLQKSPRLLTRLLPWETIGLKPEDVEKGDVLIDWRYALSEQEEQVGIRFVHLFNSPELADLAMCSGFTLEEEFESDGEGGKLGLYQKWRAI